MHHQQKIFLCLKKEILNMDANIIMQGISTVGFPIVACAAMFWKVNKQDEQHKQEMDAVRTSLEHNTEALVALTEKLNK